MFGKKKDEKNTKYLSLFKNAKISEMKLLSFYRRNYELNMINHEELYNKHLKNLELIDKSIPNMKSMKKTFITNCPNEIKPTKFSKKKLSQFLKNERVFLKNYNENKMMTRLEFLKHHLKIQIFNIIHQYFETMVGNIRNYQIFFINDPSTKSKSKLKSTRTLNSIKFGETSFKSRIIEPTDRDYRDAKTIKVKLTRKILIEVIFTLNNGKEIIKILDHDDFYLDQKDIFNMLKEVISLSNTNSNLKH